MRKYLLSFVLLIVLFIGAVFIWKKIDKGVIREPIPSAYFYKSPSATIIPKTSPTQSQLPAEVNLAIPFTVQAPHANWNDPYGEFCEEASVLMAASYVNGWTIPNPDFANQKLLEIESFEEKRFGYSRDTTAEETAVILKEFYGIIKVKTVYDPTINDIKKALSDRKVQKTDTKSKIDQLKNIALCVIKIDGSNSKPTQKRHPSLPTGSHPSL